MSFAIITDSASNLTPELLDKYNIDIVSLSYEMDDKFYPCYNPKIDYNEHGKQFYNWLREGKEIKTSLPSPSLFIEIFKKHLEKGEDIIYVALTSAVSGTINSATNAKDMILEEYPDRKITIIDSANASFGEGLSAIRASELREQGYSYEDTIKVVEEEKYNIRSELTVDNLIYLKRGGRVKGITYLIGTLLHIKPMLTATSKPSLEVWEKARGRHKALRRLLEIVDETQIDLDNQIMYIGQCDCDQNEIDLVVNGLKEKYPNLKFYITMFDFCTGAHVGPGTFALFYKGKDRHIDR